MIILRYSTFNLSPDKIRASPKGATEKLKHVGIIGQERDVMLLTELFELCGIVAHDLGKSSVTELPENSPLIIATAEEGVIRELSLALDGKRPVYVLPSNFDEVQRHIPEAVQLEPELHAIQVAFAGS